MLVAGPLVQQELGQRGDGVPHIFSGKRRVPTILPKKTCETANLQYGLQLVNGKAYIEKIGIDVNRAWFE